MTDERPGFEPKGHNKRRRPHVRSTAGLLHAIRHLGHAHQWPGELVEKLVGVLLFAQLKEAWSAEHARWSKRDLSAKHYVYFWADGIHVQARLEDAAACLLVIIGATPEGKKELVGLIDGVRFATP